MNRDTNKPPKNPKHQGKISQSKSFRKTSIMGLLRCISQHDSHAATAFWAFLILTNRLKSNLKFLRQKIKLIHPRLDDECVETIINEMLLKLFSWTGRLQRMQDAATEEDQIKILMAWMCKVALNEASKMADENKAYQSSISLLNNYGLYQQIIDKTTAEEEDSHSPLMSKLLEALKSLSDRDRDILLTYYRYEDGNKQLPRTVLKELCNKYGIEHCTLRQIKLRSFKKVMRMMGDSIVIERIG